jgi:hypothetical protein
MLEESAAVGGGVVELALLLTSVLRDVPSGALAVLCSLVIATLSSLLAAADAASCTLLVWDGLAAFTLL